jgi:5-phospho-D-xylono-1,4-lactonase
MIWAMPDAQVISVDGPLPAAALGPTDAHEHLFLRTPALPGDELDDLDRAVEEVREGQATGLRALVELTPIGCGRRPELLRAAARATGVAIIAATGYHRDAHYPADHWLHEASVELLTQRILADLREGMHPSDWDEPSRSPDPARAGVIKAGASEGQITASEHRRLEAAARAGRQSGAPVVVHTEAGTMGAEIVELMLSEGLDAGRLTLAHMDRNPDVKLHEAICARGVSLVYDTPGRAKYGPDSERVELIAAMVEAGHAQRLMLGLDLGRRAYFRAYGGGPGLRHLLGTFVPQLRERVGAEAVEAMLVHNPARIYSLAPVPESVA